jgi:ketosteroid isomerase-like protein
MSERNKELIREMLDAFVRGEYEAALEAFDPEVEGDFTHMPDGQMTRGREDLRKEVARWQGTWEALNTEIEGIEAVGDNVVLLIRQSGTGKGSGAPMEMSYGQVFSIRDEKIVWVKTYLDRTAAFEDAGTRLPGE